MNSYVVTSKTLFDLSGSLEFEFTRRGAFFLIKPSLSNVSMWHLQFCMNKSTSQQESPV